ncbi:MAG: M23 family peptidase [Chloroflexi bacterium]|nr:M23 family peptidase [Chloroflexota bacterium]
MRIAALTVVLVLAAIGAAFIEERRTERQTDITVARATPTPVVTPTPEPTNATATPLPQEPAVTVAPVPIEATLLPEQVGQGESAVLSVVQPGAASASVMFLNRRYPLLRDGDVFWTPLGVGLVVPLGEHVAEVSTRDEAGLLLDRAELRFRVVPVTRPIDYLQLTEELTSILTPEAAATEFRQRSFERFNLFEARPAWDGLFIRPTEGIVTTEFGQGRSINQGPVGGFHSGLDIANAAGTPIVAPAPGRISWAGPMPIRGNTVLLDHGAGVVTGYHHLLEIVAEVGQEVEQGELIARMGSTGLSTGPHLHWEMTIYGINVDPDTWTHVPFAPRSRSSAE